MHAVIPAAAGRAWAQHTPQHLHTAAVASTASGVLCAAVTHPFDTIKTVAQGDLGGAGFRGTTAAIYRDGGAAAFFRGFGARGALICCCFFIFNETKLRLGAALWPDQLRDARAR